MVTVVLLSVIGFLLWRWLDRKGHVAVRGKKVALMLYLTLFFAVGVVLAFMVGFLAPTERVFVDRKDLVPLEERYYLTEMPLNDYNVYVLYYKEDGALKRGSVSVHMTTIYPRPAGEKTGFLKKYVVRIPQGSAWRYFVLRFPKTEYEIYLPFPVESGILR